jgi:hypothetical protein
MEEAKIHYIYCDPHFVDDPYSHHSKHLRYFKKLMEINRHQASLLLRARGKRKPATSKFESRTLHRVKLVIDFASNLTNLSFLLLRRRNDGVVIINLNTDPFWLLSVVVIRKILRGNFALRLRFIGTVDRWYFDVPNQSRHFKILNRLLLGEDRFTSESLAYAKLLSNHFKRQVVYLPYPPIDIVSDVPSQMPLEESTELRRALFIGIPRIDKGYLELPDIVRNLVHQNWVCTVQGYEGEDRQLREAAKKIRDIPGVIFINNCPADKNVQELILETDIVLLPYSPVLYKYRNSAMNFNSLYLGKWVASYASSALYSTADELNLAIDLGRLIENGKVSSPPPKSRLNALQVSKDWLKFIT